MKISRTLYDKVQLDALKEHGVVFDFDKDYTDDEIVSLEDAIADMMMDYGFTNCEPNDKCAFWEKIFDTFQDNVSLVDE